MVQQHLKREHGGGAYQSRGAAVTSPLLCSVDLDARALLSQVLSQVWWADLHCFTLPVPCPYPVSHSSGLNLTHSPSHSLCLIPFHTYPFSCYTFTFFSLILPPTPLASPFYAHSASLCFTHALPPVSHSFFLFLGTLALSHTHLSSIFTPCFTSTLFLTHPASHFSRTISRPFHTSISQYFVMPCYTLLYIYQFSPVASIFTLTLPQHPLYHLPLFIFLLVHLSLAPSYTTLRIPTQPFHSLSHHT